MKKLIICLSVLLISPSLFSQKEPGNPAASDLSYRFFKTAPLKKTVSDMTESLISDLGCSIDTIITKTDSSLFYLRAYTSTFNPFNISAIRIEIQVTERKIIDGHTSKAPPKDTLILMEAIIVGDSTAAGLKSLKEEFKRLRIDFSEILFETGYKKATKKSGKPYQMSYFVPKPIRHLSPSSIQILNNSDINFSTAAIGLGSYYQDSKRLCLSVQFLYKLNIKKE
jgi:hypothetical protein